jgi:hypothetical protein
MKKLILCMLVAGCAPANYAYNFDISNPGARNLTKPGERDVLEDGDIKAELLVDPTSFQAVAFDLTNKTESPIEVSWSQISIVGPDKVQNTLHSDSPLGAVESGARVSARLVPFQLPAQGDAAKAYDNSDWELVVPMVVRGMPVERRYQLHARALKL